MSESDRNRASNAGESDSSLRQRAIDAYDSVLDSASDAGRRTGDTIGEAPLVALGAGVAVGALLAALIPTSRRERDLLRPYGDRVTGAARDAAEAARRTGSDKLRELGLTPEVLADKASEAAKASAQAAVGKFRDEAGKR
ncbi:MAG TPA: hypothetical protein VHN55_08695 [Sphingomicrobium sp.]|nr:hypothetical protein [Sphingomicrobium sp.]